MLLVLVPTPYVDASTAWAFSEQVAAHFRRRRRDDRGDFFRQPVRIYLAIHQSRHLSADQ